MSEEVLSVSERNKENWMNSKWRPMMGWVYMLVCIMDFVGFPILWSLLQSYAHGQVTSQWQPLTLQGAGLFHLAMGAVLGISAYGRTKEKIAGAENGGLEGFGPGAGTTYIPPGQGNAQVSNQPNMNNGYGSSMQSPNNFGSTPPNNFGSTPPNNFGSTPPNNFGSTPPQQTAPQRTMYSPRPGPPPQIDRPL
jgi:Holin of 3TMs, for gene-transfer release